MKEGKCNYEVISKRQQKQQGITLIALIVTIIILLILAGVTINVAIGDNGLFKKTKEAVETYKDAEAKEKINMAIAEYWIDINSVDMPKEEQESHLLDLLSNIGPVTDEGTYYEVIVDGYVFWVDKESQEITSKGPNNTVELEKITVKEESITVNLGQTKLIEIELKPTDASTRDIEYESSDSNIVEVKNGTVKGISEGTATVTIKSSKNPSIKAEINVTVREIKLTSITVDKTNLEFMLGDTTSQKINVTQLEPEDATNKTLRWSTSDENVATVNNKGEVTAVGKGNCIITVASEQNEAVKAEITVEVKEIEVDTISLDTASLTVGIGKTTEALTATISPENATNKTITWSSSATNIATVSNGVVTGVAEGTATITVTTANGKTATCQVNVIDGGVEKYMNINGKRTQVNTKVVYGATVTGYTCDRSDVGWQLFYIDSEDNDRVYLIASNYVAPPTNNASINMIEGGNTVYPRGYRFGKNTSGTSILENFTGTIPSNSFTQKYLSEYAGVSASSDSNLQATNYMLDQSIWSEYKGTKADYAFGGPTLSLFESSFNDICDSSVKLGHQQSGTGYQVNKGEGTFSDGVSGYGNTKTQKGMYFKGGTSISAAGMWIASPSSKESSYLMIVNYVGNVMSTYLHHQGIGVRPVIALKSDVQFIENEDGTYTIKP